MRLEIHTYKYGDYVLRKGEKLEKTMIIMSGSCNNVLDGLMSQNIARPPPEKNSKSKDNGPNNKNAQTGPTELNFSSQTILGKMEKGDIFGYRLLRDSEYVRIGQNSLENLENP